MPSIHASVPRRIMIAAVAHALVRAVSALVPTHARRRDAPPHAIHRCAGHGRPCAFILALSLCIRVLAAQGQGAISGTVLDAAGNPVPFVEITLLRPHTDFRLTLPADSDGTYLVARLGPGPYTIAVTSVIYGISVATVMVEDFKTAIGSFVVNNPTSPGGDDTGRACLDSVREQADIAPGQQGSAAEGAGPYGFRANMSFNVNGQRGQNNNFLLDGMDNNDNRTGSAFFNPPAAAIGAVNLMDGYIPAASGHATGASVSVYTRSEERRVGKE